MARTKKATTTGLTHKIAPKVVYIPGSGTTTSTICPLIKHSLDVIVCVVIVHHLRSEERRVGKECRL